MALILAYADDVVSTVEHHDADRLGDTSVREAADVELTLLELGLGVRNERRFNSVFPPARIPGDVRRRTLSFSRQAIGAKGRRRPLAAWRLSGVVPRTTD